MKVAIIVAALSLSGTTAALATELGPKTVVLAQAISTMGPESLEEKAQRRTPGDAGRFQGKRGQGKEGDRSISREDYMAGVEKHFEKVDTDADGVLSADEARAAKQGRDQRRQGFQDRRAEVQGRVDGMFVAIDADQNGGLSRSEVEVHFASTPDAKGTPDKFFARFDRNADGVIDRDELRRD